MTGENTTNIQPGPAQRVVQLPKGREGTKGAWRAPFHYASTLSWWAAVSAVEVPSSGGKGGRKWQASTHLLEPVPSIVSVNNSLLLICESPQAPFMPLPYCFPSPLPSLLFTALWTVRLFLCMPCEKVSWKEKKMSLSQVPKFSSLTWILSICYL